jgi:hypothetical protein
MCFAIQKVNFFSRLVSVFKKNIINLPKMQRLNFNKKLMQIEKNTVEGKLIPSLDKP